ncbi:hypothetical protein IEK_02898 [Bacillus toyonensis]|uniref:helix-turn-helix domain-containing protein n=1 Tax=Bacillus toyonensis TaxID=155322 RepID=UPI00027BEB6A|nr:ImmA/IrrE family metallo-endopeptidase [Bacillus toyonensis]EJV49188.1 hypothetical protein IEK_02898 [Bacillus toyonensis]
MGVRINVNRSFCPDKLKEGRESRGLTIRELSEKIGLRTHQALSKYENGKSIPPAEVLLSIMNILNLPYDYFFEDGYRQIEKEIVYFRSKANTTAKLKRIHEIKISWLISIFDYLETILEFPKSDLPETNINHQEHFMPTDFNDIENIASELRRQWDLNDGPISDVTHLFEKHGIVVSLIKSEDFEIDACSRWIGNKLFILVGNERSTPSRIKFTLAHELGHYLLHKHVKKEDFNKKEVYKRMEDEANYFASSFLMPAKSFSEELISHTLDYYLLLKKRWQISIQAMIYRSRELNIINDYQASYLWKQIAKKGWRIHEPYDDVLQNESPLLLKEAIDLIIDNHVKMKKQLCEEVRLCQSDIEAIVNLPIGYLDENKGKGTVISFKKI